MTLPTMDEAKVDLIRRALEETGGNCVAAAKLLKVSHKTIYRWKERSCNPAVDGQNVHIRSKP